MPHSALQGQIASIVDFAERTDDMRLPLPLFLFLTLSAGQAWANCPAGFADSFAGPAMGCSIKMKADTQAKINTLVARALAQAERSYFACARPGKKPAVTRLTLTASTDTEFGGQPAGQTGQPRSGPFVAAVHFTCN